MDVNIIASLLLIIAMVLVVAEMFLPTFGLLGLVGIASFIAYIYIAVDNGFASPVDLILIILGLILILIELSLVGFGIPGIVGSALLFFGLVGSSHNPQTGMVTIFSGLIIAGGLGFLLMHFGYSSRLVQKSILNFEQKKEEGYVTGPELIKYLNKEGVTKTMLRPSGTVDIEGDLIDVSSRGTYIEKGTKIEAIKIENGRLIVREVVNK